MSNKKERQVFAYVIALLVFVGSVIALFFVLRKQKNKVKSVGITEMALRQSLEKVFSPEVVPYILAQSAMETGNFTSNLFKNHRNFLGMRVPKEREFTRAGIYNTQRNGSFSSYSSLDQAANDLGLWFLYHKLDPALVWFPGIGSYLDYMKTKGYFTEADDQDGQYVKAVKQIYNDRYK